MKQLVNQPVATILGVEFGIPPENATDLQKVLYNVFLLPHEERDYAYLESQGIHLNKKERAHYKCTSMASLFVTKPLQTN